MGNRQFIFKLGNERLLNYLAAELYSFGYLFRLKVTSPAETA